MSIEILILGLTLLAIVLVLAGTVWSKVPPMPTSAVVRGAMLDLVDGLDPATIYELGAGWGGLAGALGRSFPGARVIAIELSPLPWLAARLRFMLFGPGNVQVLWGNALKADLSDADLVVCFLCPEVMRPLDVKLAATLKPGTRVLSNTFALPGRVPEKEIQVDDLHRSMVYLYRC